MSEMVERVAAKMAARRGADWARMQDIEKAVWVADARSAVEGLREPTEDMLDAADDPFHDEWRKQKADSVRLYGKEGYASSPFSQRIWQAMVGEALK